MWLAPSQRRTHGGRRCDRRRKKAKTAAGKAGEVKPSRAPWPCPACAALLSRSLFAAIGSQKAAEDAASAAMVSAWFTTFDKNKSGVLERDQLKALLEHLNPGTSPDDAALDMLMQKATAIDTTGDGKEDTTGAPRRLRCM
eukprot:5945079-Prymnesium_polylepis.1